MSPDVRIQTSVGAVALGISTRVLRLSSAVVAGSRSSRSIPGWSTLDTMFLREDDRAKPDPFKSGSLPDHPLGASREVFFSG